MNNVSFEFLEVLESPEPHVVQVRGRIHGATSILQMSRADALRLLAQLIQRIEEQTMGESASAQVENS